MSKLESLVVNEIKMLSVCMIREGGSGNSSLALTSAPVFYSLFCNHLKYDLNNIDWINKDRLVVSNKLLPTYYAAENLFSMNMPLDNLKDYKKLNSNVLGYDFYSNIYGDIIGYATGIACGEKYLSNLEKKELPKSKIIDFYTYAICTYEDIQSGVAYEVLRYAVREKLNKLITIVVKEDSSKNDFLMEELETMKINVVEAKSNDVSSIDDAIEDAKKSDTPTVILVDAYFEKEFKDIKLNRILTSDELNTLMAKYKINDPFNIDEKYYEELRKNVSKRMTKEIEKWNTLKNNGLNKHKIKEIIDFLETKEINITFNVDNIKVNNNYDEALTTSDNKIFNIIKSKSQFIIDLNSNNKYVYGNKDNNDIFNFFGNTLALGTISLGLSFLGLKVFVHALLIDSNILKPFIKCACEKELDIHYIFTNDTFLNTFDTTGISALDEISSFRLIPKLYTFRPADVNEIIGVYNILANYTKVTVTVLGNEEVPILSGTNPKYVVAGAYRILREKGEANGILIATGAEVNLALKVAEELLPYGIDLRVVSMPSMEMFASQTDRYKYTLLPKDLNTFVIEFGSSNLWNKYATSEEHIFGIDQYTTSGTKEELLNKYNLDIDSIKTKIIELMKR